MSVHASTSRMKSVDNPYSVGFLPDYQLHDGDQALWRRLFGGERQDCLCRGQPGHLRHGYLRDERQRH